MIVVRVLFILAVAAWQFALPWMIQRQEVGGPLGPVARLAQDAGTEQMLGRATFRVRWVTGRGMYVATVDQKTEVLLEVKREPLRGGYELASYLLLAAAAALLIHLITGLLVRSRAPRYRSRY